MTESDIVNSLTKKRVVDGLECAEEFVFFEYDSQYSDWASGESDVSVSEVNELEKALVALRVAREVISESDVDDSVFREIASQTPCEGASIEEFEETVELFEKAVLED